MRILIGDTCSVEPPEGRPLPHQQQFMNLSAVFIIKPIKIKIRGKKIPGTQKTSRNFEKD